MMDIVLKRFVRIFIVNKILYILINISNKSDSSLDVCCLRRFNNSIRCSSSKINSLFLLLIVDVFEERRIRFDEEEDRTSRRKKID
jgi:hypothetical protein